MTCRELTPLPRGIAGQFVGTHGGRLIVAGGSYWSAPPWNGGRKIFVDEVYTLSDAGARWELAGRLPLPLAYGAATTMDYGMICVGGQTEGGVSAAVFLIRWEDDRVRVSRLADLPQPLAACGCGGALGNLYVAGGQERVESPASGLFLELPVASAGWDRARWRERPGWLGPARILPSAAGGNVHFYLAGGAELIQGSDGNFRRRYLADAFRYNPATGWERLPNLPHAAVGAPAVYLKKWGFVVFGGDTGALAARGLSLRDRHPGFERGILRYAAADRRWLPNGELPVGLVTTGAAAWRGAIVIAGGEHRPGDRSPRVIAVVANEEAAW